MTQLMQDIPWRRLINVGRPFWVSTKMRTAYLHLFAVLMLMAMNIALQVINNFVQGKVARSIQHWDTSDIKFYLLLSLLLVVLQDPVMVFTSRMRSQLILIWREWLSTSLFHRWYDVTTKPYFWIITRRKDVANPDQRMTQDPDSFTTSTITLLTSYLEASAQIVSWAGVLLSLSYEVTWAAIGCALVSTAMVIMIGNKLVGLTNQQMDAEADLRITAGRAREGAEAIAFGKGEEVAESQAVSKLRKTIGVYYQMIIVNMNIQLFTTGWNLIMPLVPTAILVYMAPGPVDYEYIVRATGLPGVLQRSKCDRG